MNWLFRRHFWVIHAMFLCIVAIISAKTFTTLFGYWVSKRIPEKPSGKVIEESEPESLLKNFALVSERNLFNARREHVSLVEEEEAEVDPGRWQDAQPSGLPFKLISTMVFPDMDNSRALIVGSSGVGKVYSILECRDSRKSPQETSMQTVLPPQDWQLDRPCNMIEGIATVKRIEEFRVIIFNERDRRWEYLSLLGEERRMMRPRPHMEEFAPTEGGGVRKVGPTSYEIEQGEFDRALSNVARLMTEARAVPEMDASGSYLGFKIVYLKEDSLFEKIGIEKMDVLTRINGYELNSPEKALQLFGKLKTANQFTIDLKRGDRAVTLDYSVVR